MVFLRLLGTSSQLLALFLLRCPIPGVPSLVPHPGFLTLDLPSWNHLAEVSREARDIPSWLSYGFGAPHSNSLPYFCHPGCPILRSSSWMSHLGCSILEPSGRRSQERTGHILMAFLRLLGTSSQLPDLFLLGEGCGEAGEVHICHGGGDTEATKVTGLRFSFFPRRECDMELLQEELDKMEMSCLRGESAHEVGGVVAVGHRSEALTHPHLVLGHVCYPRASPSSARARATSPVSPSLSTWGQEHWEGVSTQAIFFQSPRTWSSPRRWPGTFLDSQGGCHPSLVAGGQCQAHAG